MGLIHHDRPAADDFGLAIAAQLKARHPFHTAKLVAQDLGSTVKAAENLLSGHLSAKSITRLIKAYGLGFLIDAGAAHVGTTLHQFLVDQAAQAQDEQQKWEREQQRLDDMASRASRARLRGRSSTHVGRPGA